MRECSKDFGVPGIRYLCCVQCFFVKGGSGYCGNLSGESGVDGVFHISVTRTSRCSIDLSGFKLIETNGTDIQYTRTIRFSQSTDVFFGLW